MICGIHKLVGHLSSEEKKIVSDIILNMVQLENIVTTLKRKRPESVKNIKQVYNVPRQNSKMIRGPRS